VIAAGWLLALGCVGAPAEPVATPSPPEPVVEAAPAPAPLPAPVGEPIALHFTWSNISAMHRDVMLAADAKALLGRGLIGLVGAPPAPIRVSYDAVAVRGEIALVVESAAAITVAPRFSAGGVDLAPLAPITRALVAYRQRVARMDMRFHNFRAAVWVGGCRLEAAEQRPYDGGVLSPCVGVAGAEVCGEAESEGVRLPAPALDELRRCFGA